jgi:hypothetical protein
MYGLAQMRQASGFVFDHFINTGQLPTLPQIKGKWFFVDPLNGSDERPGTDIRRPLKTLLKAYQNCTSWYGDGICVLSSGASTSTTSCELAAVIDWTKYGITVVGVAAPTAYFSRARLLASSTVDLAYLINVSGQNNSFYNVFMINEGDAASALGCLIVSGNRNYFSNCHFLGGQSATPGAELLCNSLSLMSSECVFDQCTFGTNSTVHAAANAPIQFTTTQQGQNLFRNCRVISKSSTSGHGGLNLVGTTVMNGWTIFDNCQFVNFSATGGANTNLTKVVIGSAQTDCGILLHNCSEVGWAAWSVLASKVYVGCSGETAAGAGGIASVPAA